MKDSIAKAAVLIEALPYIQSFKDKIVVIKYGGSAMAGDGSPDTILQDVVFMATVGMRPVIVHGGGKEISRRMAEVGMAPKFVHGLRVTDEQAMEIVEDTLFGEVNRDIVRAVEKFGGSVLGVSGKNAGILHVRRYEASVVDEDSGAVKKVDIGFVGKVERVEIKPILTLCEAGIIPVIAPIGSGPEDHSYNVNADTAAGEIAIALRSEKLVFLTDVHGILRDPDDPGSLLSSLHVDAVDAMISEGAIYGGMIPKVGACLSAVKADVHKTHIIDGRIPHALLLEIFTDEGVGTQIVR
ncbi:MAG: acetylglutamate kinase [Candidatus Latescibacteria bacterium]|nr:acetylglutamate kinase [Candidatus Latescibacterota bacterium]